MDTPSIVERDIENAVDSAIRFGVSAADFKKAVAQCWDIVLYEKRERDAKELAK